MEDEKDLSTTQDVGDGSEGTEEAHEQAGEAEAKGETPQAKPAKTYTPEQLRRAIAREVARERKKYEALEGWRSVVEFFESAGPEAKARLQELIHELHGSVRAAPQPGGDRYEAIERRLAYREAVDEIADRDDFFRKHRTEFYEWCDEEGYDEAREDPRILKLAYRAWRNDPAVRAALEAESKPAEQPKGKPAPGGKGIPTPKPAKEKSELEILRELKIPLFTGEE